MTWIPPMLATLADGPVRQPGWFLERKLDGERCMSAREGDAIRLLSRNQQDLTLRYPEVAAALLLQAAPWFVADGEIVAFEGPSTSFARLQRRMHVEHPDVALVRRVPVFYYLFDLLELEGRDVRSLPLRERKALLRATFAFAGPLRYVPHRTAPVDLALEDACRRGWEGLVAKRVASRYVSGRSRDWLKLKCVLEEEFVVGGYTEPRGSRSGFGALILGYFEGDGLRYAGRVGTGFDETVRRALLSRLQVVETPVSPFVPATGLPHRDIHWVSPELVVQVGFSEWTPDGRLRHPRFLGVRDDKAAAEVGRPEGLPR